MDRKQSEEWQSRLARTVNSAACFSFAYVLITYLLWFATGLSGWFFKFDSFVYYYGVRFILNTKNWNAFKAVTVYSAGPLAVFFIAMICHYLYRQMKEIRTILNLFFLWVFMIGASVFLGQFIIAALGIYHYDSLYYQGLAVVFAWLKLPVFLVYILNVMVLIAIIYLGVSSSRMFLSFSFSYSKVNSLSRRRKYFFETGLAPFILGALVTIVAVFPKDLAAKNLLILLGATHIIYLSIIGIILCIGWLSLAYIEISKQELLRYKSLQIPSVMLIIFMVVSWAYIYITFGGVYLTF